MKILTDRECARIGRKIWSLERDVAELRVHRSSLAGELIVAQQQRDALTVALEVKCADIEAAHCRLTNRIAELERQNESLRAIVQCEILVKESM